MLFIYANEDYIGYLEYNWLCENNIIHYESLTKNEGGCLSAIEYEVQYSIRDKLYVYVCAQIKAVQAIC